MPELTERLTDTAPPDAAERQRALDITQSWIVEAPAGSGKTGLLIQRYLKLLAAVEQPEAVLALTFTNKATAEMRNRVLEVLDRAAEGLPAAEADPFERQTRALALDVLRQDDTRGWRLRTQPHRLNIRTIDSLCGEIARSLPVLSGGIGLARPVPDAGDLYATAARRVFLRFGGNDASLNQAIGSVLLQRDGNLPECEALLAEMLGSREQWGELVPLQAELLNDATLDSEVRPRLDAALESAICSALTEVKQCCGEDALRELAEVAHELQEAEGYNAQPNPLQGCVTGSAPGMAVADLTHWKALAGLLTTKSGGWRQGMNVNQVGMRIPKHTKDHLLALIDHLQGDPALLPALCALRELPPERYPDEQWRMAKALFQLLRQALIELKLLFAEREVCDFPELSINARAALRDPENSERLAAGSMRLQHLLVDEMQDTSSSQYELLESLTGSWDGRSQTVFLVGDPKQSIYLFRQARVERFLSSMRTGRLGGIPLGRLQLTANFRSGAILVGEFNTVFQQVFAGADGGVGYTPADAVRQPKDGEELRWNTDPLPAATDREERLADRRRADREEAETIAKLAHDWRKRPLPQGRRDPWKIAVLVRARSHVFQVTRKLAEAGVHFRAVEIERLDEKPEVLDALALTRALLHPADRVAWLAVLRAPWCGLSLRDLHTLAAGDQPEHRHGALRGPFRERLTLLPAAAQARAERTLDVLDEAVAQRGRAPVAQAVERAWMSLGGDLCVDALARANVQRYLDLLQEIESRGEPLDAHRLKHHLQRLFAEPSPATDAVDVMTIHKAKGLEWDLVLVPGMQKGGGRNAFKLLDWMELPTRGKDARAQVLLAPIPARGDEAGTLNGYLRKQRAKQEGAELKRLLYVVTTRARTSLQLFASPRHTATGGFEQKDGSLLRAAAEAVPQALLSKPQALLPKPQVVVSEPFERAIPIDAPGLELALAASAEDTIETSPEDLLLTGGQQAMSADLLPPDAPEPVQPRRLPLEVAPRARLHRASNGTHGGLSAQEKQRMPQTEAQTQSFARPQASLPARALGNAVHAFLEHLALRIAAPTGTPISHEEQMVRLREEMREWHARVDAVVRSSGLSPRETHRIATLTMDALENTLTDPEGRWLLQPHTGAVNEAELTGEHGNGAEGQRLRLDRSFFAGDAPGAPGEHVLWIVDYKTAGHSGAGLPEFLRGERAKYEPQLRAYAKVRIRDIPADTSIMLALYHPLQPTLQYWRYVP